MKLERLKGSMTPVKWSYSKAIRIWNIIEDNNFNIGQQTKDFVTKEVPEKLKEKNIECERYDVMFITNYSERDGAVHLTLMLSPNNEGLLLVKLPVIYGVDSMSVKDEIERKLEEEE